MKHRAEIPYLDVNWWSFLFPFNTLRKGICLDENGDYKFLFTSFPCIYFWVGEFFFLFQLIIHTLKLDDEIHQASFWRSVFLLLYTCYTLETPICISWTFVYFHVELFYPSSCKTKSIIKRVLNLCFFILAKQLLNLFSFLFHLVFISCYLSISSSS